MTNLPQPTKVKYLTNKDLLAEIHKSKISYCSYVLPEHAYYDFIVPNIKKITKKKINDARKKKLTELLSQYKKLPASEKPKKAPKLSDIPIEKIVIRVMTFDHIPMNPEKEFTGKTENERHIRCNFPPFQHFILKDDELTCVLKSHWKHGLENGEFCKEHGKMTHRLASMFIKLVDRYGHRGNWRGYCEAEDAEALTQRGWLGIDEITENDMILSCDEGQLKWSNIKSIYRGKFNGLMHKLTSKTLTSLVTPGHKFVTDRGLIPVEYLLPSDSLILIGSKEEGTYIKKYDDSFVELIGWIVTEGNYEINKDPKHLNEMKRISIWQNNGPKADRIRNCLTQLGYKFSESDKKNICFAISRNDSKNIQKIIPEKNLNMPFILSLTSDQRDLLINTMIDGDGHRLKNGGKRFDQKNTDVMNMFQALCTISGYRTKYKKIEMKSFNKSSYSTMNRLSFIPEYKNITKVRNINFNNGLIRGHHIRKENKIHNPNIPTEQYNGRVWCPETEYGCFIARRNGSIYLTGNTYVDEMKSQALLQLSQVGLQFDESRSETPNPFAYLTQVITNSFMRILNIEKKNQNIRDDMLIMHGAAPSHTRQTEDYLKQHDLVTNGTGENISTVKPKRSPWGRKPKAVAITATPVKKEKKKPGPKKKLVKK